MARSKRNNSPETQHPFDRTKVSNMVELEDKYYQKKYDLQLLDDLCALYSVIIITIISFLPKIDRTQSNITMSKAIQ